MPSYIYVKQTRLPCSVTRLGDFLNFTLKLAQMFGNFLGDFKVSHFLRKTFRRPSLPSYTDFFGRETILSV